jgi:hypothetical protein
MHPRLNAKSAASPYCELEIIERKIKIGKEYGQKVDAEIIALEKWHWKKVNLKKSIEQLAEKMVKFELWE